MARRNGPGSTPHQGVVVEAAFINERELRRQFNTQRDYFAYLHLPEIRLHQSLKGLHMLAPAYPTPLSKSLVSNYGFYCWRRDGGFCFHNFHSAYAARWFVDFVIDGKDFEWLDDNTIETEHGFKIRGERDSLEKIMEYKPKSNEEREWQPNVGHLQYYETFAGKRERVAVEEKAPEKPTPKKRERKPVDEEVKVQRRKAKVKSGDYITIAEICDGFGRPARDCRAALRAMKVEKPQHGWSWPKSEAEVIRKRVARHLGIKGVS